MRNFQGPAVKSQLSAGCAEPFIYWDSRRYHPFSLVAGIFQQSFRHPAFTNLRDRDISDPVIESDYGRARSLARYASAFTAPYSELALYYLYAIWWKR